MLNVLHQTHILVVFVLLQSICGEVLGPTLSLMILIAMELNTLCLIANTLPGMIVNTISLLGLFVQVKILIVVVDHILDTYMGISEIFCVRGFH